ncbi:MAG TPA: hypothetical protein VGM56_01790 [Byssovorax sp.]|jgi:hypothetical protein
MAWTRLLALVAVLTSALVLGCGGGGDASLGGGGAGAAAPPLVAEAGFFSLPKLSRGRAGEARMFYSFHPADHAPEQAPLVVFFNGGPGAATTGLLLPFGTGPMTLDASDAGTLEAKPNPDSWTRFANVLYLDSPAAGFSYSIGDPGCTPGQWAGEADNALLYLIDAGDFVRAVLDFLDAHPALIASPVVVAGESYGGQRGMLMELLLLHYDEAITLDPPLPVAPADALPWLRDRVQRHVDLAFPDLAGAPATSAQMQRQFGTVLFIEPGFGRSELAYEEAALDANTALISLTATQDVYDYRLTQAQSDDLDARTAEAIRDPATLEALLGVPLANVPGLAASERVGAARELDEYSEDDVRADEAALSTALGQLPEGDAYWLPGALSCEFYPGDVTSFTALELMPELRVFITRARYDLIVMTPALLGYWRSLGFDVALDEAAPAGALRPGVVTLTLPTVPDYRATIRMPYYLAGHSVPDTAGAALANDGEAWLRDEGILSPP